MQRPVLLYVGSGNVIDDGIEQRCYVTAADVSFRARITLQGRGVDDRKVELLVARAQSVEQLECLVEDPVRAGAVTVDFVDHDNRCEAVRKGLLGNKTCLWHRAVDRVDEQ